MHLPLPLDKGEPLSSLLNRLPSQFPPCERLRANRDRMRYHHPPVHVLKLAAKGRSSLRSHQVGAMVAEVEVLRKLRPTGRS
jgi:hypothetical protein